MLGAMDDTKIKKIIQLGEFCRCLEVADREVRYVLERGFVPSGAAKAPATGNHRQFGPEQAFWLALVVKLRQFGLKTSLAAATADAALQFLRGVTQNLGWERPFLPQLGWFHTDKQYLLEVADGKYVRMLTDTCPSEEGLHAFDWVDFRGCNATAKALRMIVVLSLDLAEIARILGRAAWTDRE